MRPPPSSCRFAVHPLLDDVLDVEQAVLRRAASAEVPVPAFFHVKATYMGEMVDWAWRGLKMDRGVGPYAIIFKASHSGDALRQVLCHRKDSDQSMPLTID